MVKAKMLSVFSFLLVSALGFVSAHTGEDEFAHHSMMGSWAYGGFFGYIFMALWAAILVLIIFWLIKQINEPRKKK